MKRHRMVISAALAALGLLLVSATSVQAQWCDQVCQEIISGAIPYPDCNWQCNNGGGDYTTCNGAGYPCCVFGRATHTLGALKWVLPEVPDQCYERQTKAHEWGYACPNGWHGAGYSDCFYTGGFIGWAPCPDNGWGQQYC